MKFLVWEIVAESEPYSDMDLLDVIFEIRWVSIKFSFIFPNHIHFFFHWILFLVINLVDVGSWCFLCCFFDWCSEVTKDWLRRSLKIVLPFFMNWWNSVGNNKLKNALYPLHFITLNHFPVSLIWSCCCCCLSFFSWIETMTQTFQEICKILGK
jgi:hypothetical protein